MGEHELLRHLRKDHARQKELGKRLGDSRDPQERNQLRRKFYDLLHPHMAGEEVSIFPRLKEADEEEARDDGLEGLQEHHVAKIVLRELMKLDTGNETFRAKAKVLDEMNAHHIEEEEGNVFKHLLKLCDDQELDRLFQQYEKGEEEAKS